MQDTNSRTRKHNKRKVVFKVDRRQEQYLMQPSLEEFVPADHLARFIDAVIDRLDIKDILARYKGGGANACTRDVEFMWIAGTQTPSFMTLSEFRKSLGKDIKTIFKEVVKLAMTAGVIDGSEIYIDHTKVEANANRYRITWRKNV